MWIHVLDVCFVGLASYLVRRLVRKRSPPLPPGPPGWPLIGNLLEFPTYAPYKTFAAMSGKYGKYILTSQKVHYDTSLILPQALLCPSECWAHNSSCSTPSIPPKTYSRRRAPSRRTGHTLRWPVTSLAGVTPLSFSNMVIHTESIASSFINILVPRVA